MSDGEGAMDGFEVGGLITAMQRTVIPVGTQLMIQMLSMSIK